jgi:hypothetical protein
MVNIFNFIITLVGIIAFAVLLYAGFLYLTSAGNPEERKKAKERIKSVIFGVSILLLSYLILTTINPELTTIERPPILQPPLVPISRPPKEPPVPQDTLARIRSLVQSAKESAASIAETAQQIKSLTDSCDCDNTEPFCDFCSFVGAPESPPTPPQTPPQTPPPTPIPTSTPPSSNLCQNPQQLAQKYNVPYPAKRAASLESLLNCIAQETGRALPPEGGSNSFYGSLFTYDHTHPICNYTRGERICGPCSHSVHSCHYGGSIGTDGALAADFGNENNGNIIIKAALKCGAQSARCENSNGKSVECNAGADHVHVSAPGCVRL